MNARQVKEIAFREIVTRARSRGFRAITGLMLVLAIAAPIAMNFLPSPTDSTTQVSLGIGAGAPADLEQAIEAIAEDRFTFTFTDVSETATVDIDAMLTSGDLDLALLPPSELVWSETENSSISNVVVTALGQLAALERASDLGLELDQVIDVFTPPEVERRFVTDSDTSEGLRQGVAFFGLFLAFLLPQIFGQLTMLSVVEEKSTRVVEVLLSHIRPSTLLVGKILGLCALAIVQLLLIVTGLIGSLLATKIVEVPAAVWQFVPMLTLSVLGGLAIYTTLFALLGSLISRQEDAAQVMMPVFAPLMVGYFVGQAAVFGSADSLWVRVLTWFPLTSPMLLPVRVVKEAIGPVELAVSLLILAGSVALLVKLAARVYEFTLLRTGSRVGWGELIRLSRGTVIE